MTIFVWLLTFLLILVSLFVILVVLAQKAKSDGGVGAAMGGGMAEAAFGADTGNVLSKSTINAAIAFFVLSLVLFLAQLYRHTHVEGSDGSLPNVKADPVVPTPAAPAAIPATQPPAPAPSAP